MGIANEHRVLFQQTPNDGEQDMRRVLLPTPIRPHGVRHRQGRVHRVVHQELTAAHACLRPLVPVLVMNRGIVNR